MKRILTFLSIVVLGVTNAQVLIDDTTTPNEAPDASAVLELRSADKGLLVPRLTAAPAGTPVEGLVYYDITRKCFKGYNGTSWEVIGAGCLNAIPVVSIDQADSSIAEGDSGTQAQTVTITLDRNATEDIVVTLVYTGTANTSDYSAPTSVTIANGSDSATFDITVNGDTNIEADETVIVSADSVTFGSAVIGNENDYQLTIITDDLAATCNDSLVEFGFNGNSGDEANETADATIANVSNAVISRGDGLGAAGNGDRFNAVGGTASDISNAINSYDYFEISFDIANGYTADITAFDFNWQRSGTGATEVELRSNLDNYTSTLGSFTGLDDSQDNVINITSMNNVSGTVTFRLYAWGASGGSGSFGFEGPDRDVTIIGCLSAGTANPEVQFSEATATISEEGETSYTVTLNVSNPGSEPITANITTTEDNASAGTDYTTTLSSPIIIPAGATSTTFSITAIDDTVSDAGETVTFEITDASSTNETPVIGSTNQIVVTIADNDASQAQTFTQNFDGATGAGVLPYTENTAGQTYTGNGSYPNTPQYVSAPNGYGVNNGTMDVDFGPVDTSTASSASVTFRLASFAGTSGNGADGADYVAVYISTDGGTTWSSELEVSGNSNSRYGFDSTDAYTMSYDGDDSPIEINTGSGDYSIITIDDLPNSTNLLIGIFAKNNHSNEDWIIDDVVVTVN